MPALSFPPAARVVLGPQLVGVSSRSRHRARQKKRHSSWTGKALMRVIGTPGKALMDWQGTDHIDWKWPGLEQNDSFR